MVDNPLDRYLINSTMLENLRRDADGGVSLYLQSTSPGAELESNWLPAPNGPMFYDSSTLPAEGAGLERRMEATNCRTH
jgi:hypothetical protein